MRENLQPVLCYPGTSPVDFAWEKFQKPLHFVQRGRILLRCGSALALSLPSLGVSSLDLGRLFTQAALFSFVSRARCSALRAASQNRDRTRHRCPLRPPALQRTASQVLRHSASKTRVNALMA